MTPVARETVDHELTFRGLEVVCACGRSFRSDQRAAKRHLRVDAPREREDELRRALLGPEWRTTADVSRLLRLAQTTALRWLRRQQRTGHVEESTPGTGRRWRALP